MKRLLGTIFLTIIFTVATGQTVIDSLKKRLALSRPDTSRVAILGSLCLAYSQSDHEMAMKYAQEGLALARKLKFLEGEADCLRRSGLILTVEGRYPEALDIFQRALRISEKIDYPFGIAAGLGHLGNIYFEQEDYPNARSYYFRYLRIAEDMRNQQEQANALRNIGRSYLQQNLPDSALIYYNRMYELIKGK